MWSTFDDSFHSHSDASKTTAVVPTKHKQKRSFFVDDDDEEDLIGGTDATQEQEPMGGAVHQADVKLERLSQEDELDFKKCEAENALRKKRIASKLKTNKRSSKRSAEFASSSLRGCINQADENLKRSQAAFQAESGRYTLDGWLSLEDSTEGVFDLPPNTHREPRGGSRAESPSSRPRSSSILRKATRKIKSSRGNRGNDNYSVSSSRSGSSYATIPTMSGRGNAEKPSTRASGAADRNASQGKARLRRQPSPLREKNKKFVPAPPSKSFREPAKPDGKSRDGSIGKSGDAVVDKGMKLDTSRQERSVLQVPPMSKLDFTMPAASSDETSSSNSASCSHTPTFRRPMMRKAADSRIDRSIFSRPEEVTLVADAGKVRECSKYHSGNAKQSMQERQAPVLGMREIDVQRIIPAPGYASTFTSAFAENQDAAIPRTRTQQPKLRADRDTSDTQDVIPAPDAAFVYPSVNAKNPHAAIPRTRTQRPKLRTTRASADVQDMIPTHDDASTCSSTNVNSQDSAIPRTRTQRPKLRTTRGASFSQETVPPRKETGARGPKNETSKPNTSDKADMPLHSQEAQASCDAARSGFKTARLLRKKMTTGNESVTAQTRDAASRDQSLKSQDSSDCTPAPRLEETDESPTPGEKLRRNGFPTCGRRVPVSTSTGAGGLQIGNGGRRPPPSDSGPSDLKQRNVGRRRPAASISLSSYLTSPSPFPAPMMASSGHQENDDRSHGSRSFISSSSSIQRLIYASIRTPGDASIVSSSSTTATPASIGVGSQNGPGKRAGVPKSVSVSSAASTKSHPTPPKARRASPAVKATPAVRPLRSSSVVVSSQTSVTGREDTKAPVPRVSETSKNQPTKGSGLSLDASKTRAKSPPRLSRTPLSARKPPGLTVITSPQSIASRTTDKTPSPLPKAANYYSYSPTTSAMLQRMIRSSPASATHDSTKSPASVASLTTGPQQMQIPRMIYRPMPNVATKSICDKDTQKIQKPPLAVASQRQRVPSTFPLHLTPVTSSRYQEDQEDAQSDGGSCGTAQEQGLGEDKMELSRKKERHRSPPAGRHSGMLLKRLQRRLPTGRHPVAPTTMPEPTSATNGLDRMMTDSCEI